MILYSLQLLNVESHNPRSQFMDEMISSNEQCFKSHIKLAIQFLPQGIECRSKIHLVLASMILCHSEKLLPPYT